MLHQDEMWSLGHSEGSPGAGQLLGHSEGSPGEGQLSPVRERVSKALMVSCGYSMP